MFGNRYCQLAALLLCGPVWAAHADLSWIAPTQNTDGTPLTDLAGYTIYAGCNESGSYELQPANVGPEATTYRYEGLPNGATCYFTATAVNAAGVESAYSNESVKITAALDEPIPGPVENLRVEWAESGGYAMTQPTVIQSSTDSAGWDNTLASVVSGNALILTVTTTSATWTPQLDTEGAADYSLILEVDATANCGISHVGIAVWVSVAAGTHTSTSTGGGVEGDSWLAEIQDLESASNPIIDSAVTGSQNGTSFTLGTVTLSGDGILIKSGRFAAGGTATHTDFTHFTGSPSSREFGLYRAVASGTYNGDYSYSTTTDSGAALFALAGAGGGGATITPSSMLLMGIGN